jgi:hypothetical protein
VAEYKLTVWRDGVEYHAAWIDKASDGKGKHCANVHNHIVKADEWRLRVDNNQGYLTPLSKGKKNQYFCVTCAMVLFGTAPPRKVKTERLF